MVKSTKVAEISSIIDEDQRSPCRNNRVSGIKMASMDAGVLDSTSKLQF